MPGSFIVGVKNVEPAVRDEPLEDVILLFVVEILRNREAAAPKVCGFRGVANEKVGQPIGPLIGEWLQKDVIDDAEDDCCRADSERERKDAEQREGAILQEPAEAISQVLQNPT